MLMATNNAPIQIDDIVSSTPSHLDIPKPAPTATTQIGQTALAAFAQKKPEKINPKDNNFLFNTCCILKEINYIWTTN